MSFVTLPTELIELVLLQVEDRKSLISFPQTCKRFHQVAHSKITERRFEILIDATDLESYCPLHFLLASHKARQIVNWAFSASDPDKFRRLLTAIEGGIYSLIEFVVTNLGLTYVDAVLERIFYKNIYVPLKDHITPIWGEENRLTLLNMAMYIDICHHEFQKKLRIAMNNHDFKSAASRRRSLGNPRNSAIGKGFLQHCIPMSEDREISRLTRVFTQRLKGWHWPVWRIDDNGADIVPHIYGIEGLLSLFEGRRDHLPPQEIINAMADVNLNTPLRYR